MSIKDNVKLLFSDISQDIKILAATKQKNISEIEEAIGAGIKIIGENYVKEAESKLKEFKGKAELHFIGHLQTNKVRKAVEIFDMIQTVDSEKIANEIDKECKKIGKIMPMLLEINIAGEENKSGIMPNGLFGLANKITHLKNLKLKGLMTMGPNVKNPEELRPYFKEAKILFDEIKKAYPEIDTLSMGMSDSYKIAIEEGANMVRLGTIIFGNRE
jgi:hypothetical protein